jgi:hypothetical protein
MAVEGTLARAWTPQARIVAVSFLVLYLELALIRWVAGYVHNFGYFTNFTMLAAFLGVGTGCLVTRRVPAVAYTPCFLMALALVVRVAGIEVELPTTSATAVFWAESIQPGGHVPVTGAVVVVFVLVTATFVGLGQLLGELFGELPRLRAYALNVLGSLLGIVAFGVHARYGHPPIVWFGVVAALCLPFLAATPRVLWPVHAVVLGMLLWVVGQGTARETWSPYYRQTLLKTPDGYLLGGNGVAGIMLADFDHLANNDTQMYATPYSDELRGLRKRPDAPIRRALVIGCGGGNDVAMALLDAVEHVDAVDINPWVIDVGKRHHPLLPLDSDRVSTFVADGREFLARSGEPYDLVVYGLPDSTFTNDRANLRTESFIFTVEAFRQAIARLSADGVFVVYNYYRVPWLVRKIRGMLREASGQEPYLKLVVDAQTGVASRMLPAAMAVGPGLRLPPAAADEGAPPPATDDWPFLYLTGPTIPEVYVVALAAVGAVSLLLVLGALRLGGGEGGRAADRPVVTTLFFMGVAFVLLEARSVVTFGLFFGSTWWNNVVVFAAIHVSVLLAVLVSARFPRIPLWLMATALLASLAFALALPPERLLVGSESARAVLSSAVAFLPVFCANVLFANVFGASSEGRVTYAFNLLGGMLGGLLEYVSLLLGYRALIGLAGVFYLLALLFAYRRARAAPAPA